MHRIEGSPGGGRADPEGPGPRIAPSLPPRLTSEHVSSPARGPTRDDERQDFPDQRQDLPEVWVFLYDRRTGRPMSRFRATDEEARTLLERRAATGPPMSVIEPVPVGDRHGGEDITTYTYSSSKTDTDTGTDTDTHEGPPSVRFEHDAAAGVFRLIAAAGAVEMFRDRPTKYLSVEPDDETGGMRPVMKHGRPVFLWLCREEHEVR